MKYKIIVDSSSNLQNDYLKSLNIDNISFGTVPLSINTQNKLFLDNDDLNLSELFKDIKKYKSSTACPSPQDYLNQFCGADYYIVITIAQKLSGSYNSACMAKELYENPDNIFVLDSRLTAGALELLVNKSIELIKENKRFFDIRKELSKYCEDLHVLFILQNYDNLIKNGRLNKFVGMIAKAFHIVPVMYGYDGEIKIKDKCRTIKNAIEALVNDIGKIKNIENKKIIISHSEAVLLANKIKDKILSKYNPSEIIIRENRGLCGYYCMPGGIIVSF